jgi:hypothetical protein
MAVNIIRTLIGPQSKYNDSLPFTYEARIDRLDGIGEESDFQHYYADTLCALVDYMDDNQLRPEMVKLFAVYATEEIEIDLKPLLDDKGQWIKRPKLCKSLEDHYAGTLEKQYKGHEKHSNCNYTDRDNKSVI